MRKTLLPGIARFRSGDRPTIRFGKYVERLTKTSAFIDELIKLAEVDDDLAQRIERRLERTRINDALKTVSTPTARRHVEAGVLSSAVGPAAMVAGRTTQALVSGGPGGRARAVSDALKSITKGEVAGSLASGAVFGSGLSAARTAADKQRAKSFLRSRGIEV